MEIGLAETKWIGAALAAIGFLMLAMLVPEERTLKISEIAEASLGEKGKFYGIARNVEIRNGNAFFSLEDGATVKAVFFRAPPEQAAALRENRAIEATGTITLYKGAREIIVERVREID